MTCRLSFALATLAVLTFAFPMTTHSRGFGGGGFHGGGGGFGGGGFHGGGGFGGGGVGGGGGYHGGGGYGGGGFSGYGGGGGRGIGNLGDGGGGQFHGGQIGGGNFGRDGAGQFQGGQFGGGRDGLDGAGNFRGLGGGGYGPAPSRSQLNNFLGLPSDEGMHNMTSNPFAHAGGLNGGEANSTHGSYVGPNGGMIAGGATVGPRGGEAAHGAIVGPNGGVVAGGGAVGPHGGEAGRGAAVGPNGRIAAGGEIRGPNGGGAARGFAAGPNGWAAGFARVSPSQRYAVAGYARSNYNHWNYFGPGWYTNHPGAWFAAGWIAGQCWWPCTWGTLGDYCAVPYSEPIYYDYGNNVVYQDGGVYVDGVDQGTPEQYYSQAQTLAANGAQVASPDSSDSGASGDWLPLGVFLLTRDGEKDSHDVFQLAINKQGVIRGNFQDSQDGKTEPIQGSADLKTQRVAFTVGDKTSTVIETGLYNLTKDEAPVLIHIGTDQTEQWLLVRLKNPDVTAPVAASAQNATTGAANDPAGSATNSSSEAPLDEPF